jgi:hypothetical protein
MLRANGESLNRDGFEADTCSMSRRLAPALLCALLLLAVPTAASAQAPPPDERVAARAFADITLQAAKEIQSIGESYGIGDPPSCKAERRLARGTERQQLRFLEFWIAQEIAALTRALEPTLARTVTALDAVPTADKILIDGREAWHSVHDMYSRIAKLERVRVCSVMRDYVRGDYKRTRAMRRAARIFRVANDWDTRKIDRAMRKAEKRLVKLGVPAAEADGFDGEITPSGKPDGSVEDEGTRGSARAAAQAPAPSSPLTSLRAAR